MPSPNRATDTREILIVDDDPGQRSLLTTFLTGQGFHPTTVTSGEEALDELKKGSYKMMISDVRMPGMTGLETLRHARAFLPDLPILLVTAYADVKDAVGAMRDGALNYLEKPIDLDELLESVAQVLKRATVSVSEEKRLDLPPHLIAASSSAQQIYRDALLVAPSESRVVIVGESGVGKATIARLIHDSSPRNGNSTKTLNCSTPLSESIDSLLFGSEHATGLFMEMSESTLVLEDIGELPLSSQAKLLQVIQTGIFRPEESNSDHHTTARIIATSKTDLTTKVQAGDFRDDLYFRLNVMELVIPPLRERREDIVPLATSFIKEFAQGHARFAATVLPCIENYPWPGNIRELRNAMERATLMAHGGLILPKHLPAKIQAAGTDDESGEASQTRKMADVERETILQALRNNRNNRSVTARELGISRRALTYKLQRYREDGYLSES